MEVHGQGGVLAGFPILLLAEGVGPGFPSWLVLVQNRDENQQKREFSNGWVKCGVSQDLAWRQEGTAPRHRDPPLALALDPEDVIWAIELPRSALAGPLQKTRFKLTICL
ncbi:hypothetical protein QYF61_009512 [Mycteria americana]|uniref:Uncharacterized protein n=1 Tax=Mycteria americana TaxID=33587 RepID=A0AAN7MP46_MYCAM|nr:hypothetical protein QYF61_009512 [Mycteria americana]